MKLYKRITAAALALVLCLSLLPTQTRAASESDLTFRLNEDRTGFYVVDCDETASGSLTIPSTYAGLPVTGIGTLAFVLCTDLTSITIPSSVTYINELAFKWCTGLTDINIPGSVTSIGQATFFGDTSLTSITIPDRVTIIDSDMFSGCTSLTSVTIGNGVTQIDSYAFDECDSLTDVYYNGTEEQWGEIMILGTNDQLRNATIHYGAPAAEEYLTFSLSEDGKSYSVSGCDTSAGSVTIPSTYNGKPVTGIGAYAFYEYSNMTSITIPDSVTSIGYSAFENCTGLTSITIPDSVTIIDGWAFSGCTGLTSITIPDSVTSIGNRAFAYCDRDNESLTDVYYGGTEEQWAAITIGSGNEFLRYFAIIHYTEPAAEDYLTFTLNSDGESYYVSDCDEAASGSLTIPSTYNGKPVTSVGNEAFYNCTKLSEITIPDSVTTLCFRAFSNCTGLTSVIISEGVTEIWAAAFDGCTSLTSVTIPDSVTDIGSGVFANCTSLTSLVPFPEGVTIMSSGMYQNCTGLTSITIPDNITKLGACAFSGCSNLTTVVIPESVTSFGAEAFSSCTNLTSITLPDSTTDISYGMFANCGLTSITIGSSVTSINGKAFSGCNSLTDVYYNGTKEQWNAITVGTDNDPLLNATIHYAEPAAENYLVFADGLCTDELGSKPDNYYVSDCDVYASGSLTIPATYYGRPVAYIGYEAFLGCYRITDITIPVSITSIEANAFAGCTGLTDVYYAGTKAEWDAISIDSGNEPLLNATIHYNYDTEQEPQPEMNVDRAIIRLQEQMKMGFYYEMATEETVLATGAIVWTGEEYAKETAFDINHTCGKKYSGQAENTDGTYYSIETDGIPAQAIDTELYILPYTKTANGYSYGETIKSNSILNVAKNQYNSEDTTEDVKAVIVDVLNYATAARDYFVAKGEMEAPAEDFNAILSDSEKDLAWSEDLLTARADVQETWEEYSPATDKVYVNIQDSLKIQFVFADTSVEDGMYWQGDDYTNSTVHDITTATGKTEVSVQNGYVSCAISGINAYNIYDNFYVRAWGKEGKLTRTYTHSIAAYLTNQISACQGKTDAESQALVELCQAMLIYGKSAQENDAVNKG